jgi:hypothetical protein
LLGRRDARDADGVNDGDGEAAGNDIEDITSELVGDLKDDDRDERELLCGNDNGDGGCEEGIAMEFGNIKGCVGDWEEELRSLAPFVDPKDRTLRGSLRSPWLNGTY